MIVLNKSLLTINNLSVTFKLDERTLPALDGVSFTLDKKETLGIVGESGSGKSVTALSIMRLLQEPPAEITSGKIWFNDENLIDKNETEMGDIRGNKISMIYQEPMSALNPVFTIGYQIAEVFMEHQNKTKKEALELSIDMLRKVQIPNPQTAINKYPHELSGGMRQRVMIAMALACNPEILIADEPTTALDVTVEAQILKLIRDIKEELDSSIIFISHDLGVIREIADKVIVMYCGRIVEQADSDSLFDDAKHPYTKGLIGAIPHLQKKGEKLKEIPGNVPAPDEITKGCRFKTRCEFVFDRCLCEEPDLIKVDNNLVRCWLYEKQRGDDNV